MYFYCICFVWAAGSRSHTFANPDPKTLHRTNSCGLPPSHFLMNQQLKKSCSPNCPWRSFLLRELQPRPAQNRKDASFLKQCRWWNTPMLQFYTEDNYWFWRAFLIWPLWDALLIPSHFTGLLPIKLIRYVMLHQHYITCLLPCCPC